MCKRLLFLISFVLMLALSTNVQAQPTGEILIEYWNNMGGTNLESNFYNQARFPDDPDDYEILTLFDKPYDPPYGDNYGAQIRGYLYPPETGDYTFWMACDDDGDLFLSTDGDPANKVKIAEINGWCPAYDFDNTGGTDNPDQVSAPVSLVAGQKYYIEAAYKEGGGGDGFAVAWQGPGIPDRVIIDGAYLSSAAFTAALLRAASPVPADGTIDADVATLEWTPGPTAVTNRIYLSTDDVIDDADLIGETSADLNIQVAMVDPGVTYWWRVDQVEADGNVIEGDVWTFSTLPLEAHFPSPADGAINILTAELSWTGGKNAILHNVNFGTDPAALLPVSMMQAGTTYDAGALEDGKTYYWRVDEFTPMGTITGPVWSFTSPPLIEVTDPNLVGAWTFEEGPGGTVVVDYSGHGSHGIISGAANQQYVAGVEVPWMPGLSNYAMEFLGDDQGFVELPAGMVTVAKGTIAMWINTSQNDNQGMLWYASHANDGGDGFGGQNEMHLNTNTAGSGQVQFFIEDDPDGPGRSLTYNNIGGTGWRHVAATWDVTDGLRLYVDGVEVASTDHNNNVSDLAVIRLGRPIGTGNGNRFYDGIMDEVMLYDIALPADQIAPMGRDLKMPWDPDPRGDGAAINQLPSLVLSWNAGEGAVEQDVYIGTDLDAVTAADATDTTGIYVGRQAETTLTVDVWDATYYWRADQVQADGSIIKGHIWSFGAAGSLRIDMSTRTLDYDNTVDPFVSERVWDMPAHATDWTLNGVLALSMQFRGVYPNATPGSSTFDAATGTYEITSAGNDIWGSADQFQYVYRELTGNGSITVRVTDNGTGSNDWAKGGVMIRQDFTQGSPNAFGAITGGSGNGGTFQWREEADGGSGSSRTLSGIAPPYWVRLTRFGNDFTCEMSADGVTWELEGDNPHTVAMTDPVLIGLAVTSHQSDELRTFTIDNVSTTGNVTGEERSVNVGANDAGPLYAAVEDAAGNVGVVTHPLAGAVQLTDWTNWKVSVSDLAAQGVDPTAVARLAVGVGDGTPDGTGSIEVDNIEVITPTQIPASANLGAPTSDVPGFLIRSLKAQTQINDFAEMNEILDTGMLEGLPIVDGSEGTRIDEFANLRDTGNGVFSEGNGYPDKSFPGTDPDEVPAQDPAAGDDDNDFATEILGCIQLTAGLHTIGANSDDGTIVWVGGIEIGRSEELKGTSNRDFTFYVAEDGYYDLRARHFERGGGASIELHEILPDLTRILLNDVANGGSAVSAPAQ